ncbi:MAG: helix-turn-helix transcriptional regulator [Acutalibacteraceae bacterium]|nr:helix-turn-helix transcriptional regulator [Acutalibacteraceae bacterium]
MFKRIRDMREDKDLTQKQLADYLKIHQTTYSDYEIGKLNVPIDVFIKLAHFYNTSIDYLAGITDNPTPYK